MHLFTYMGFPYKVLISLGTNPEMLEAAGVSLSTKVQQFVLDDPAPIIRTQRLQGQKQNYIENYQFFFKIKIREKAKYMANGVSGKRGRSRM